MNIVTSSALAALIHDIQIGTVFFRANNRSVADIWYSLSDIRIQVVKHRGSVRKFNDTTKSMFPNEWAEVPSMMVNVNPEKRVRGRYVVSKKVFDHYLNESGLIQNKRESDFIELSFDTMIEILKTKVRSTVTAERAIEFARRVEDEAPKGDLVRSATSICVRHLELLDQVQVRLGLGTRSETIRACIAIASSTLQTHFENES